MAKGKGRTIFLGSDPWAPNLHRHLARTCRSWGYAVKEVNKPGGKRVMYYEIARRVAVSVAQHEGSAGIVLCGTGMGVSMVANSFPGISCALCESTFTADRSRVLNNANVLAMGEFLTTPYMAAQIAKVFLTTEFLTGIEAGLGRQIKGWHKDVRNMKSGITVPDWIKASEGK
jgi:ribose 5-phosphate isomerase B